MSIIVACDGCRKRMRVADRLAGKRVRCKCGDVLTIPALSDEAAAPEPVELSLFAEGDPIEGTNCPSCSASMAEDAVICLRCGFNRETGRCVQVAVESSPSPQNASDEGRDDVKKRRRDGDRKRPTALGPIVKVVLVLVVVSGLGLAVSYIRGAVQFDPRQQLKDAEAAIKIGMTPDEVVATLNKRPSNVFVIDLEARGSTISGMMPKERKLAYVDDFINSTDKELLKNGFRFEYRYTNRHALLVAFGPDSKVMLVMVSDRLAPLGL